jgi:hypothetical protein
MCGANASHVILPVITVPAFVTASSVKVPPSPDLSKVTLPVPVVAAPPRTVLTSCDASPFLTDRLTISADPSFGFQNVSVRERPCEDCCTLHSCDTTW